MNKKYNSKKFLQKKKRLQKVKRISFFVLIILVLVGFLYWMRHPSMNVDKIEIVKNSFTKAENIEATVHKVLEGNKFLLIPKTNALFLPREETEEELKKDYPEIEKIDINLQGLHKVQVEIFEYRPVIILKTAKGNYFVNSKGDVFIKEPILHPYDDLIVLEKDLDVNIGDNVIEPDFLEDLNLFSDKLNEIKIKTKLIKNPEEDIYRIETDKGFEIVISSADDLTNSVQNIQTILENGALSKEDLSLIDYLDLRFGNKVFYKLKE